MGILVLVEQPKINNLPVFNTALKFNSRRLHQPKLNKTNGRPQRCRKTRKPQRASAVCRLLLSLAVYVVLLVALLLQLKERTCLVAASPS